MSVDPHHHAPSHDPGPGSSVDALTERPAAWLAAWVADPAISARAEAAVAGAAEQFGDEAVRRSLAAVAAERSPEGHRADPVLRALMRAWMGALVSTSVSGAEHLSAALGRPVVAVSNHLSLTDTTATECALLRAGGAARAFADRMVALAGPKVWDTPLHALATLALNIVPTLQSERVAAGGSEPRAAVLRGLALARAAVADCDPLLVYPEGTRSRSGRLGPFLSGVRHYLSQPGTVIVPLALTGTDALYPIGADRLRPGPVHVAVGPLVPVDDPLRSLSRARQIVIELLPERHRPEAGTPELQ